MKKTVINESKKSVDLALAKCFSSERLSIEEIRDLQKLSQSDLIVDYECDLYFVEKVKTHLKNELYRLRAQNQQTPIDKLKKDELLYPDIPYTRTSPLSEAFFKSSKKKIDECPEDEAFQSSLIDNGTYSISDFEEFIGMLRFMHLWYHSAHHCSRGISFGADHDNIFGDLYSSVNDEIDAAIEKTIGVTNNEGFACPVNITKNALALLEIYPSPPSIDMSTMVSVALEIEQQYIQHVEDLFTRLENQGSLTLGLNDFLSASANLHESHVYKLSQRNKVGAYD